MFRTPHYKLVTTLHGDGHPITSLCFSPNAKFIAAAGASRIVVYNLSHDHPVAAHAPPFPEWGQTVTCLSWIYFQDARQYVLLIGSSSGIRLWQWTDEVQEDFGERCHPFLGGGESAVLSIDVDQPVVSNGAVGRIAFARENRDVVVWTMWPTGDPIQVFRISLPLDTIPATVRFSQTWRCLTVFARHGGKIIRLHGKSGDIVSVDIGPHHMRSLCVDEENDRFVAWVGRNSWELLRLSSVELLRTMDAGKSFLFHPKQAAFVEDGKYVVTGTDRGCATIFNVKKGRLVQTLAYPRGGLVQQIATSDQHGRHLIAIAGASAQQPAVVLIYRHSTSRPHFHDPDDDDAILIKNFFIAWLVAPLVLAIFSYIAIEDYDTKLRVWISQTLAPIIFPSYVENQA